MDLFDQVFGVLEEEVEFELRESVFIPWADHWLNPRQLRGSDFLMRWSQGAWSELRLKEAVNRTGRFYALPYGPSGAAPDNDPRKAELYFLRLEQAGIGKVKRPDLLLFRESDRKTVEEIVLKIAAEAEGFSAGDDIEKAITELPFTPEDHPLIQSLLSKASLAIECENSLWVAKRMPLYGQPMKPMKRLGGKPGLKKNSVLPTVILKNEDRDPLKAWQRQRNIPIHIWHVFYDLAFGIALDEAERLIAEGLIEPIEQTFQAPGGQVTKKAIYKIYYHYAYELGEAHEQPSLIAASIIDKNGHVLPYVKFEGGSLALSEQALAVLEEAASKHNL
ncbi:MAG TPA: AccI family restriction endonuclease [Blastocatellia bacterium]|nr:AccI family restriction endonuclease [Blastocatellia bacterium]